MRTIPAGIPGRGVCARSRRMGPCVCLGREVTVAEVFVLIGVGILAGIVSSVASLASVVSYPA
jgi:hypothetical protein